MPTRNVVITDHQAALLDRLVASGRYQNVSEAMRDGLRRLEDAEEARQELAGRIDAARADIADGRIIEGDAGDVVAGIFEAAIAAVSDNKAG